MRDPAFRRHICAVLAGTLAFVVGYAAGISLPVAAILLIPTVALLQWWWRLTR